MDRGLSCSDFSISSKKLMMLCSLASESSAPPSGSEAWLFIWPWRSRLSVVRELESASFEHDRKDIFDFLFDGEEI